MTPNTAEQSTFKAFAAADDAWGAELRKAFGKEAGDIRYTITGKGKPGTALYDAYVGREATYAAWRAEAEALRVAS